VPGAEIVASSIVRGLKGFHNSPFLALLSEKGQALPAADAKYLSDILPVGAGDPAATAPPMK
jgi:hypothetical protein